MVNLDIDQQLWLLAVCNFLRDLDSYTGMCFGYAEKYDLFLTCPACARTFCQTSSDRLHIWHFRCNISWKYPSLTGGLTVTVCLTWQVWHSAIVGRPRWCVSVCRQFRVWQGEKKLQPVRQISVESYHAIPYQLWILGSGHVINPVTLSLVNKQFFILFWILMDCRGSIWIPIWIHVFNFSAMGYGLQHGKNPWTQALSL